MIQIVDVIAGAAFHDICTGAKTDTAIERIVTLTSPERIGSGSSDGTGVVRGDADERLIMRWDLENEEAHAHVERRLQRMGVIAALERAGFEPGDDVQIGETVFELDPSY